MAFSTTKGAGKTTIIFGSFSRWYGIILYSILLFYLLGKIGAEDPSTAEALKWGMYAGIIGVIMGGVLSGLDRVETPSGYEDVTIGLMWSLIFLTIGLVINLVFVYGKSAYGLIGSVTALSKGERLFASLAASFNEELFFRFAVQRLVQKGFPDNPFGWIIPVGVSSASFSIFHWYVYGSQGIDAFVYLFILGAMAGIGMAITKRFSIPLMIHAENNLLAFFWGV